MIKKAELIWWVKKDFCHDLRWLLCSVSAWELPITYPHIKLYTSTTAFTFARSLYEFFTCEDKRKRPDDIYWKLFGLEKPLESSLYDTWRDPLQKFVMHPTIRMSGNKIDKQNLKNRPSDFASDILRLTVDFEKLVQDDDYSQLFKNTKQYAIDSCLRINKNPSFLSR